MFDALADIPPELTSLKLLARGCSHGTIAVSTARVCEQGVDNRTKEMGPLPTGPQHQRYGVGTAGAGTAESCRCTIGEDHNDYGVAMSEVNFGRDVDDQDNDASISVHDAADIWLSNGMDDDYTSGYSEDELRGAAGL